MESPGPRPQQRERSRSSFSFRSDKSGGRRSSGSRPKIDLREPDGDRSKQRFSAQAMANPNRAIIEAEPSRRAHDEESTLSSIRSLQWKDAYGNAISAALDHSRFIGPPVLIDLRVADPDASNPSRPRMERPLDTIRSFEAAIYKGERRKTLPRREPADAFESHNTSRRGSFVNNDPALNARSPFARQRSAQYPTENYAYATGGYSSPRPPAHRFSSAPMPGSGSRLNPDHTGIYPTQSYRESHETVTTGESYGSSGTEPWGNSTDPSSENSSIDRIQAAALKLETQDAYGSYNYNQGGMNGRTPGYGHGQQPPLPQPPSPYRNPHYRPDQPPVPEHQAPRHIIRLGGDVTPGLPAHSPAAWEQQTSQPGPSRRPVALQKEPEKRKSWLKRRFSKG